MVCEPTGLVVCTVQVLAGCSLPRDTRPCVHSHVCTHSILTSTSTWPPECLKTGSLQMEAGQDEVT